MKSNVVILLLLGAYFLLSGAVYIVWNILAGNEFEATGSIGLLLSAILAGFIAFFLNMVNRSQGGILLPEDEPAADIDDADPNIGHFSPWSWWPLFLGAFAAICFAALAIGWWLFFIGFPLALVALIGFIFEFHRGQYAH